MTGQRSSSAPRSAFCSLPLSTRKALEEVARFYDCRQVGDRGPLGFRRSTRLSVLLKGLERLIQEAALEPGKTCFLDLGCGDGRVNVFFSYLVGCSVGIELDDWTLEEYAPLREELEGNLKQKGLPRPPGNVFLFPGDCRDEEVHETIRRQTGLAFDRFDLFYSFQPLQQELAELISRLARPGAVWMVYGIGDILPRFPGLTLRTQERAWEGILALYRKP